MKSKTERMKDRVKLVKDGYERFGEYILKQVNIDPETVNLKEMVAKYTKWKGASPKVALGLMTINWIVSNHFNMDSFEVRNRTTRKREYIKVKHAAIYLAVTLYKYEYKPLSDFYHLRTHAAIINAISSTRDFMNTDKIFREEIKKLTDKLLSYGYDNEKNGGGPRADSGASFGGV